MERFYLQSNRTSHRSIEWRLILMQWDAPA